MSESEDKLNILVNKISKLFEAKQINEENAQQYINSLIQLIDGNLSDTSKLSAYNLMSNLAQELPWGKEKLVQIADYLQKILELDPTRTELYYQIAEAYELYDYPKAIEYFNKVYDLNPDPWYLLRIGNLYRLMNLDKFAIDYYQLCLKNDYVDSNIYSSLGEAYISIGDSIKARKYLLKALDMKVASDDDLNRINNNLFWAEMGTTTKLINRFIKKKNSETIQPSYSSPFEGRFISIEGDELDVTRGNITTENIEYLMLFNEVERDRIGFFLDANLDFDLTGFVFRHQESPNNIDYQVTFHPFRIEAKESDTIYWKEDHWRLIFSKVGAKVIDPELLFKEFLVLLDNFEKMGLEIIPNLKEIITSKFN